MTLELTEDVMEAFHLTARTVASLPKLPDTLKMGVLPILNTLRRFQNREGKAKVTDISKYLKVSSPYVIRMVGLCEKEGFIEKWKDEKDKRIMNIRLTEKGHQVLERTLDVFHGSLCDKFSEISDEDWERVVYVLSRAHDMVKEACREFDNQLPDWQ